VDVDREPDLDSDLDSGGSIDRAPRAFEATAPEPDIVEPSTFAAGSPDPNGSGVEDRYRAGLSYLDDDPATGSWEAYRSAGGGRIEGSSGLDRPVGTDAADGPAAGGSQSGASGYRLGSGGTGRRVSWDQAPPVEGDAAHTEPDDPAAPASRGRHRD
jgi:hypothetical protein